MSVEHAAVQRADFDQVMVPNYAPAAFIPVRGAGSRVWDQAGRELIEEMTWRALVTQRWDYYLDAWPEGDTIVLPRPPLRSIVSFEYIDQAGVTTAISASDYVVDVASEPGRLRLKGTATLPSATLRELNGVQIRFEAGYGAASAVPVRYKQALKLLIGHWYENREAVSDAMLRPVPMAVDSLIATFAIPEFV